MLLEPNVTESRFKHLLSKSGRKEGYADAKVRMSSLATPDFSHRKRAAEHQFNLSLT